MARTTAAERAALKDEADAEARAHPQVVAEPQYLPDGRENPLYDPDAYSGPERRVARKDRRMKVDGYFVRTGGEKQRETYAAELAAERAAREAASGKPDMEPEFNDDGTRNPRYTGPRTPRKV